MKILKKLLMLFIVISLLGSCVAKKKFVQLTKDKDKLDTEYANLLTKFTILNTQFDSLTAKYKDLETKKKLLAELSETEMQKLNSELTNLNSELQKKIDLLTLSNKKIAELQSSIEKQKLATEQLLAKIKGALTGFTSDELTVEMKDGKVYVSLSEKLLFKSGSATVDTKGKEALKKVGEVLAKQKDIDIVIEGHTDNVPLKGSVIKDNWDLSVMRATSIVRILTEDCGVDPKQVIPSGRADNFPVSSNETTEGKAKNRRTEIILSPKISELIKILESK